MVNDFSTENEEEKKVEPPPLPLPLFAEVPEAKEHIVLLEESQEKPAKNGF
jgi:hypothetical protein